MSHRCPMWGRAALLWPVSSMVLVAFGALAGRVGGATHDTHPEAGDASNTPAPVSKPANASRFVDPEDGWLDVSAFRDTGYGFVPMVVPITEPAVGYGMGGGLIFIEKNPPGPDGGFRKPNIAAIAGMATENGTWGVFGAHSGSWFEGQVETLVAAGYGSINLDFYGIGDGVLNDYPVAYNLEPLGGLVEARYRLGHSPWRVGLRYVLADADASFEGGVLPPPVLRPPSCTPGCDISKEAPSFRTPSPLPGSPGAKP